MPDFQEPATAPNLFPYFEKVTPLSGSTVTVLDVPLDFSVAVRDPNPLDQVYVRWVSDYPEFGPNSKLLEEKTFHPPAEISYRVPTTCETFPIGSPSPHSLTLIVADRAFQAPEKAMTAAARYNFTIETTSPQTATWWVVCP